MKKRFISLISLILLIIATCLAGLTSCGDDADDKNDNKNPFGSSEGIELPIVDWEPDEE